MAKHPSKLFSAMALLIAFTLVFSACTTEQPSVVVEPGVGDAEIVDEEVTDEGLVGDQTFTGVTDAQAGLLSASQLLDYDVQSITGEISGEIEEIYVDLSSGRIPYVQIEYGGLLDIGDTEVLVPMSAFSWGAGGELIMNVDETMLENYPEAGADWPDLTDPGWDDELAGFWGNAGYDPGVNFDANTNAVTRLSELIDTGIGDLGFGEGNIDDMLIDLQQGRARYVVLDYGAGLEEGQVVAVPFSAFAAQRQDTGEILFDVNTDAETLQGAPRIETGVLETPGLQGDDVYSPVDTYWSDMGFDPGLGTGVAVGTDTEVIGTDTTDMTAGATAGGGVANAEGALMAATSLLDYDFENIDGEVSGEIEDLLIDVNTGRIIFATLEYGGFLDIGDTELPVPLSAFAWGLGGELVLQVPEVVLDELPDLGEDWVDPLDPTWDDQVNTYWLDFGLDPGFDVTAESGPVMYVSELVNTYGVGDVGYGASNVTNLLIDLGQGMARYAVIDYGGVGTYGTVYGQDLAVVPFSALNMTATGDVLGFDEDFDQTLIETAPRITDPTILDTGTVYEDGYWNDIDTYWTDQGYWEEGLFE